MSSNTWLMQMFSRAVKSSIFKFNGVARLFASRLENVKICRKSNVYLCIQKCRYSVTAFQGDVAVDKTITNEETSNQSGGRTNLNNKESSPGVWNGSSTDLVEAFREKHDINIDRDVGVKPILELNEAHFPDAVDRVLRRLNIVKPTPIQCECWSLALEGHDVVAVSPTGSGKTLGFLIPAYVHIKKVLARGKCEENSKGPIALVVTPTRELAQQIYSVSRLFTYGGVRSVCVFGGASRTAQCAQLRDPFDICIATPGRLLDFLKADVVDLNRCSFVVVDEADLMLDMGFISQVEDIFGYLKGERQSMMYTATWPEEVRSLASNFMKDFVTLRVGPTKLTANKNVKQEVIVCGEWEKEAKLCELLETISIEPNFKILLFVKTKVGVERLAYALRKKRYSCDHIHSDKKQFSRNKALKRFRDGETNILVATGVAGRGLDIRDVTHVINYDCPWEKEEYIHKIGRTGRVDATGTSVTFFTAQDSKYCRYLPEILSDCNQKIPPELSRLLREERTGFRKKYRSRWQHR